MAVTPLTSLSAFEQAIAGGTPAVVGFCATWAGLCRAIGPVFERYSELPEFTETVGFYRVDIDEAAAVARRADVGPVPVFMAFREGTRIAESVAPDPGSLRELIAKVSTMGTP
ncbi:thioredoxin family protein [Streptomyces caatingaensis]|uniref:Thioredoxin domain-containing protein n=1 Tax=Streptomyces caatingaensis TaxID=1678637 RepID=A0A0K9XL24_9ACTN|nr:thioredoxin family protein [Streptomyces caatingaensis]KNB54045.1 hypothetical protein AC230_05725 [Streptomyces caatingaensis]